MSRIIKYRGDELNNNGHLLVGVVFVKYGMTCWSGNTDSTNESVARACPEVVIKENENTMCDKQSSSELVLLMPRVY